MLFAWDGRGWVRADVSREMAEVNSKHIFLAEEWQFSQAGIEMQSLPTSATLKRTPPSSTSQTIWNHALIRDRWRKQKRKALQQHCHVLKWGWAASRSKVRYESTLACLSILKRFVSFVHTLIFVISFIIILNYCSFLGTKVCLSAPTCALMNLNALYTVFIIHT